MMKKFFLIECLLFLSIFSGCTWLKQKTQALTGGTQPRQTAELKQPVFEKLVSKDTLDAGDLELVWQSNVPLKQNEVISKLIIIDDRIYALSSQNYLVSFNRENGKPVFSSQIGQPGFAVIGLDKYDGQLYSVIGNRLTQIDNLTGQPVAEKAFEYGLVCPASRNDNFFYIGVTDNTVHTLKADNKVEVFKVAAESASPVSAILADDGFCIFSTDTGDVICIAPERPRKIWQFNAAGSVLGPLVRDDENIYIASKDTNIYCLILSTGKLKWKYPSGMMPAESPLITSQYLYQNAGDRGLFALTKDGNFLWQIPDAEDILSESAGRAFVLTKSKDLLVVDIKSGKRLGTQKLSGINNFASNNLDSKMYLADSVSGRIACLKPIERKIDR
jgi:outer membrane protein assembly factor BamB